MKSLQLRARCELFFWRNGWIWAVVAALAIAVTLTYGLVLRPAEVALQQALARASAPARPTVLESAPADDGSRLSALREHFRTSAQPTELIRRLQTAAQAPGLQFLQGEYSTSVQPITGLTQVVVQQPVRASYVQVRRYIEDVLREEPTVSLDSISVRRDNVAQAELEVRLRWTFYADGTTVMATSQGKPSP